MLTSHGDLLSHLVPTHAHARLRLIALLTLIIGSLLACDSGGSITVFHGTVTATNSSTGTSFPVPCGMSCVGGSATNTATIDDRRYPTNGNPLLATAPIDTQFLRLIWGGCLAQSPDINHGVQSYHADQCTAVPTVANGDESGDGKTTTFHIDPTLIWSASNNPAITSNNIPITAADFAFFVTLAADPHIAGRAPFDDVQSVKVVDPLTVSITWKTPLASYLEALTQIVPLPLFAFANVYTPATGAYDAGAAQALLSNPQFAIELPVSNGPFRVEGGAPGQKVQLNRNSNYHSQYFQSANIGIVYFKHDPAGLLVSDIGQGFTEADLASFTSVDPQKIVKSPENTFTLLGFNERPQAPNAAHNDHTSIFTGANGLLARKALIAAFDSCTAIQASLNENCQDVATHQNTTPPALDYNTGIQPLPFDPAGAQSLMDQAGLKLGAHGQRVFPDGSPVTLQLVTTPGDTVLMNLLTQAQQAWETTLHITCVVTTPANLLTPYDQGGVLATGNYDVGLFDRANGGDPGGDFSLVASGAIPGAANPAGQNVLGVQDAHVDAVLASASAEMDATIRAQAYHDLQAYLTANAFTDPIFVRQRIAVVNGARITNYNPSPIPPGDEWDASAWKLTS